MLDKTSFKPLYRQLADYLLTNIQEGVWPGGTQTPSEPELVQQFRVSRNTAREALNELERKGYIYRVQGKGTFVSSSRLEQRLNNLTGFSEDVRAMGITPSHRNIVIKPIPAPSNVAEKLQLGPDSEVLFLHRLMLANNLPYIVVKTYIPKRWLDLQRITITQEELQDGSLYELLEKRYGVRLAYAVMTIRAGAATREEAELLGCSKGTPVLVSERVTRTQDDTPIEYSIGAGHHDRHQWTTTLFRQTNPFEIAASSPGEGAHKR